MKILGESGDYFRVNLNGEACFARGADEVEALRVAKAGLGIEFCKQPIIEMVDQSVVTAESPEYFEPVDLTAEVDAAASVPVVNSSRPTLTEVKSVDPGQSSGTESAAATQEPTQEPTPAVVQPVPEPAPAESVAPESEVSVPAEKPVAESISIDPL